MGLVQCHAIGLPLAVGVVLGVGAGAELVVPVGFESIGDQPVSGIDKQVPLARQLGLVLGALDLEAAQPIRLVEPRLDLLLGRPADLDLRPAPARTPRLTEDSTVLYQAGTGATGNRTSRPGFVRAVRRGWRCPSTGFMSPTI